MKALRIAATAIGVLLLLSGFAPLVVSVVMSFRVVDANMSDALIGSAFVVAQYYAVVALALFVAGGVFVGMGRE